MEINMEARSRFRLKEQFANFEEVEKWVDALKEECYWPITTFNSMSMESYNKTIIRQLPTSMRYKYVKFVCSHYGQPRDRSKGERVNQHIYPCDCPFFFRVVYNPRLNPPCFEIADLCEEHKGHEIGKKFFERYRFKERMDPAAVSFAEKALADGAIPMKVQKRLLIEYGINVKPKLLQNLKQKMTNSLGEDEWSQTVDLLEKLQNNPKNIVHVVSYEKEEKDGEADEEDEDVVYLIYIQLDCQRELYKKYGGLVQIDGTYKTNRSNYSLYTIFVEDNFGVGQPVGHYLILRETKEWIMAGLEIFREYNDVSTTSVVITDKDCKELLAVKSIFPNAVSLLCQFHALTAVTARLEKAKLQRDYEEEIYHHFKYALYAKTMEQVQSHQTYLCEIEEDSLGSYFSDCWFQKPDMWCSMYRNDLFIKGNNTTNRLERYHSTIKAALNHLQARLPQLLQALIDLVTLRDLGRDIKEVESKIKFLKTKPPALLQTLSQHVTEFALKLVTREFSSITTSFTIIKNKIQRTVKNNREQIQRTEDLGYQVTSANDEKADVKSELNRCSCTFYLQYGLPCRHICHVAKSYGYDLPVGEYHSSWNISSKETVETPTNSKSGNVYDPTHLNDDVPGGNSSIVIERKRPPKTPTKREDMFNESMGLARTWANALQNLPLPQYKGHILAMKSLIDAATQNKLICLKGSDLRGDEQPSTSSQNEEYVSSNIVLSFPKEKCPTTSNKLAFNNRSESTSKSTCSQDHQKSVQLSTPVQVTETSTMEASTPTKKRPLNSLRLPPAKRAAGRPRKTKQLDRFKYTPKPFLKKKDTEQCRMFLSWFVGATTAHELISSESRAEENDLYVFADDISTAVIEDDVTQRLSIFQALFHEDAWESVLKLIQDKKKEPKYTCSVCTIRLGSKKTNPSILCDSCQLWSHQRCANLRGKGATKSVAYICPSCRKNLAV